MTFYATKVWLDNQTYLHKVYYDASGVMLTLQHGIFVPVHPELVRSVQTQIAKGEVSELRRETFEDKESPTGPLTCRLVERVSIWNRSSNYVSLTQFRWSQGMMGAGSDTLAPDWYWVQRSTGGFDGSLADVWVCRDAAAAEKAAKQATADRALTGPHVYTLEQLRTLSSVAGFSALLTDAEASVLRERTRAMEREARERDKRAVRARLDRFRELEAIPRDALTPRELAEKMQLRRELGV